MLLLRKICIRRMYGYILQLYVWIKDCTPEAASWSRIWLCFTQQLFIWSEGSWSLEAIYFLSSVKVCGIFTMGKKSCFSLIVLQLHAMLEMLECLRCFIFYVEGNYLFRYLSTHELFLSAQHMYLTCAGLREWNKAWPRNWFLCLFDLLKKLKSSTPQVTEGCLKLFRMSLRSPTATTYVGHVLFRLLFLRRLNFGFFL